MWKINLLFSRQLCGEKMSTKTPFYKNFIEAGRTMQHAIHQNANDHGWWDNDRFDTELIALEHSELSEALEAMCHGNPDSQKIPGHCHAVEELADTVIRIMDHCEARGWSLFKAIAAKHEFNKTRPHRHGGKAF